jgi:hypothetical protein
MHPAVAPSVSNDNISHWQILISGVPILIFWLRDVIIVRFLSVIFMGELVRGISS